MAFAVPLVVDVSFRCKSVLIRLIQSLADPGTRLVRLENSFATASAPPTWLVISLFSRFATSFNEARCVSILESIDSDILFLKTPTHLVGKKAWGEEHHHTDDDDDSYKSPDNLD